MPKWCHNQIHTMILIVSDFVALSLETVVMAETATPGTARARAIAATVWTHWSAARRNSAWWKTDPKRNFIFKQLTGEHYYYPALWSFAGNCHPEENWLKQPLQGHFWWKLTTHGLQKQLPGLLTEIFESKSPTTEIACKKSQPMINQVAST